MIRNLVINVLQKKDSNNFTNKKLSSTCRGRVSVGMETKMNGDRDEWRPRSKGGLVQLGDGIF